MSDVAEPLPQNAVNGVVLSVLRECTPSSELIRAGLLLIVTLRSSGRVQGATNTQNIPLIANLLRSFVAFRPSPGLAQVVQLLSYELTGATGWTSHVVLIDQSFRLAAWGDTYHPSGPHEHDEVEKIVDYWAGARATRGPVNVEA